MFMFLVGNMIAIHLRFLLFCLEGNISLVCQVVLVVPLLYIFLGCFYRHTDNRTFLCRI